MISRRRLVALVSAGAMLVLALIAVGLALALTQTDFGRTRIRRLVVAQLAGALGGRGTVHVGAITGTIFTGLTIDSLAIRDADDSLFVATGRIRLRYDPRDLIDRRIVLSSVDIAHPLINLRRHADEVWNFRRLVPPSSGGAGAGPRTKTAELRLGEFIVLDSLRIRDGTVIVTEPWHPEFWLTTRAERDSAARFALADSTHIVRRTSEGLKKTWRWTHLDLTAPYVRLADPDSAGQLVEIGRLAADEADPPFRFRDVRGMAHLIGDSLRFTLTHFDLPRSAGSSTGSVWWGGNRPTRMDIYIRGDSIGLADITWIHPTFPRTGEGRANIRITNDRRDDRILDYTLTGMTVRTERSRLAGGMTVAVGGPELGVSGVSLTASPVDFDLLRTLNGAPFPVPWRGALTGTVRARGGAVNRWRLDRASLAFHDANVPGAVTRFVARGGMDISHPALTVFRALTVDFSALDPRTLEFLFPNFPRLHGTIAGRAVLDSSWRDVRFHDADVSLRDGPAPPSRFMGSGRVTDSSPFLTYDVALTAAPLSFGELARSYPVLPLRGTFAGPITVQGTMPDLDLAATLTGAAGVIGVAGHFDLEAPGYAARGTASVRDLDVPSLLGRPALPATRLTGRLTGDLAGDSLATLTGTARIALDRSRVDTVVIEPSSARLGIGDGRLRVDSLTVATPGAHLSAHGALGLRPGAGDTLRFDLTADSLPALALPAAAALTGGSLAIRGIAVGSVDSLAARGTMSGAQVAFDSLTGARTLFGAFALAGLPGRAHGTAWLAADSVRLAGVRLAQLSAGLSLRDPMHGALDLHARSTDLAGAFDFGSGLRYAVASDSVLVAIDTLALSIGTDRWSLAAPSRLILDSAGTRLDTIALDGHGGARAVAAGDFPNDGAVHGVLRLDRVPLAEAGRLVQLRTELAGMVNARADVTGTRREPLIAWGARVDHLAYAQAHFPRFTLGGRYAQRRMHLALEVLHDTAAVLTADATLPVDLALVPTSERMLPDSLTGRIRSSALALSLLGPLSARIARPTGTAAMDLAIGGTWQRPTLAGRFQIHGGEVGLPAAGIRLRGLEADLRIAPDSVLVRTLRMASGTDPGSQLTIGGSVHVASYRDPGTLGFDLALQARNFAVVDRRSISRVGVTSAIRLGGTLGRPVLSGAITVNRATIRISELAQKSVVDLNDPEFFDIVDTSLTVADRSSSLPPLLDSAITNLQVPNLEVRIGDDVWLRSQEANIKLAGSVDLAELGARRLSGSLTVDRGTYRLDLGPVQRTFQVDSGKVTFFGDPNIPAELDIFASYVVRQADRQGQDVRIIAHIGGTLVHPQLALSSAERIPLSQTEILSYLVFGEPSFAVDAQNSNALRPVAAALLPTLGGVLERALSDQLGFFDYVQVETGTVGQSDLFSNIGAQSLLSGSRIGFGKQIGERTFVTANAGLCKLSGAASNSSFTSSLGISVERRLGNHFSLDASSEPSSAALLCKPGVSDIISRPRQYGFDLFRQWSF